MSNGRLWLWPYSETAQLMAYAYYCRPAEVTTSGQTVDFDRTLLSLIYRAIDVQVCVRFGKTAGDMTYEQCKRAFDDEVSRCVAANKTSMVTVNPLSDGGSRTSRTVRRLLS